MVGRCGRKGRAEESIQGLVHLLLSVALTAILPGVTPAQDAAAERSSRTGIVEGTVVNAVTLEPLPSATVVVGGTALGASTDTAGAFRIVGVPAGEYVVRASLIGFRGAARPDVVVSPTRPAVLRIALEEAAVEVEGVVAAAVPLARTPDFPLSVNRQSAEEIRRLPGGFEDVLRAVAILPGVARAEAGRNDLIVRGGAPSENLYLLDGIEIPNINHFGTQGSGGGPLSYINLDFVDNTTFSAGGFGPKHGDRLSSVLGIGLRDGRSDRLGGKATVSATQFGLNMEGPAPPGGTFLLSARRSYLDFIFKGAGFGFVPEYWDFLVKWTRAPSPSEEIRVLAVAAIDDVRFFNETEDQRYDNAKILGSSQRQVAGGAAWRRLIPGGYLSVTLGQSLVDFSFVQRDTLQRPLFINESLEHISSLRGDLLLSLGGGTTLAAGLGGRFVRTRYDILLPPFASPYGDTLAARVTADTTGAGAFAYAQFSARVGPVTLSAGLRQSWFGLIGKQAGPEPRFSATLPLGGGFSLSASAGRHTQPPALVWLAGDPANRSLGPITADQAVLGLTATPGPAWSVSLEGYLKRYRNYAASIRRPFLVLSNTGAGFGGSEESFASFGLEPLSDAGRGRAVGVELSARKQLSDLPWYGLVSIGVARAEVEALDGIARPSAYDQRLIVNAGGGWILDPRWEVSAKFRLATGRPYTPFNDDGTQSASAYHALRLRSDYSLDLRADRRWFFDGWTLVAYLDIQNVTNRMPDRPPTWDPREGRALRDESIGVLPSIGISAEF